MNGHRGHPGGNPGRPGGHPGSSASPRGYRPGSGPAAKAFEERTGIKAPRIVAWEITRSCNLACAHCRASAHEEPYPGELSLDECKAVMRDIASITDPILILTGGEPLMRSDIWDIIDYAHELGMHPVIGTNGTLVDDECAARIAEHGIPRVSVSLDFPTPGGQDAFRGREGAFEETIAGMRNLRAHGVGVQVNTTITKMNNHLVDDLHELAVSEGAEAFHPFLLVPTGRGEDLVNVELTPDEYEEVLTWAYHCQKTSPMHFKPTDAPQYYRIIRQMSAREGRQVTTETYGMEAMTRGCLGGVTFAFISHVGDVQPCGYFDMQLGNVKETPFSKIWETSPVFDDLRHYDRLRGKCGACEYKGVCGGCRARALAATGDYLAEEPYCAYVPRAVVRERVLDEIQSGFPMERDPYGVLAKRLGIDKSRVVEAVESMREDGTIRRIGASFRSNRLGYTSTLCALKANGDDSEIDRIAELVNEHPEVTHNYLRPGAYNLWFTLVAPSRDDIERILAEISKETGCDKVREFPTVARFKVKVDFSERLTDSFDGTAEVGGAVAFDADDPFDVELVRFAQGDLVGEEPFSVFGEEETRALVRLRAWKADGTIRRFGAMVRHRNLGYAFNGMTVWNIPEEDVDRIGSAFSGYPYVTHCYARRPAEDWPYNFYAMVHAKTQEELDVRIAELKGVCGAEPQILVSEKEYKKTSPQYFEGGKGEGVC